MTWNLQDRILGIVAALVLLAAAAVAIWLAVPTALAQAVPDCSGALVVRQGAASHLVRPISNDQTSAAFYGQDGPVPGSTALIELSEPDTSVLLFHCDQTTGVLSLVIIHDEADAPDGGGDVDGGHAEFSFNGLPDAATFVAKDDDERFNDAYPPENDNIALWEWSPCCTDGAVIEGGLLDSLSHEALIITPTFDDRVLRWHFLASDGAPPIELDLTQPVSIAALRTASRDLIPGFNLLGCLGDDVAPPALEIVEDGSIDALFGWESDVRQFTAFRPQAIAPLNTLTRVARLNGYYVLQKGAAAAITLTPPQEPQSIALAAGFNLVTWTGRDGIDVADAIAPIADQVRFVAAFNAPEAIFRTYRPDAPIPALNDLETLQLCDGIWVDALEAVVWDQSPASVSAPSDGLVAWYPFDGNARDASGNGWDGTVLGAVLTPDRFGRPNSAYRFDGLDDYIDLGDAFNDVVLPVTVSLWLHQNDTDMAHAVFASDDPDRAYDGFWLQTTAAEAVVATFGNGGPPSEPSRNGCGSRVAIRTNRWVHFAATIRAPADITLYIDGVAVDAGCSGTGETMVRTSAPARIGRLSSLIIDQYFDGLIDDLRIYDRSLTDAEIDQLRRESP